MTTVDEEPDAPLTDAQADEIVGTIDDTPPVGLIEADPSEAVQPPDDWDPEAHSPEDFDGVEIVEDGD